MRKTKYSGGFADIGNKFLKEKREETVIDKIVDKIYEMGEDRTKSDEWQIAVNTVFKEVMQIVNNEIKSKGG